ncbi:MAG: ABC transporter ATP-binding protein [Bdellovibrionota bacterium]
MNQPVSAMTKSRFLDEEVRFSGRYSKNVVATLAETFRPYRTITIMSLLVGMVARLCLLSTANISGYWADSLCQNAAYCHAPPQIFEGFGNNQFLWLLSIVIGIGFVCNIFFRVSISRTGAKAVSTLYDEVTMRVSRFPMEFFDKTPVGRIMSRFSSDYASIFRMAGGPLGEFLGLAFDLIATLILMSLASFYYVPIVILACLAYFGLYKLHTPAMRSGRRQYAAARSPSVAHFAETVQGARLIKVYGKSVNFTDRFETQVGSLARERLSVAFASQHYSFHMAIVTALLLLLTGLSGIWLVKTGRVSAGSLATAFTFILIVSTTIQQFFEWLANFEEALTGVERFDHYLRRPLEAGGALPLSAQYIPSVRRTKSAEAIVMPKTAELSVEHLWLRYGPDLPWVLRDLSFTLRPAEKLAIVGRTGSGKSSLIQALYLMYVPDEGRISINGLSPDLSLAEAEIREPLKAGKIRLDEFRKMIGLIPQDPTLFQGTLRDNLIADESGASDEKIWAMLRSIDLEHWVKSLGQGEGLDYPIEERGGNLSAGERQLICMARCFLSECPLIITDEATSAIDPASEELLVKALETHTRGRTLIIVAHRLSTVRSCDRVLWLDKGSIRMIGTPDEVLPVFSKTSLTEP